MANIYSEGTILRATDGSVFHLTGEILGEGGQGIVYLAKDSSGNKCALKWYKKDEYLSHIDGQAFYENLEKLVRKGRPRTATGEPATQFIWPKMLIQHYEGSFGYVMDLFPDYMESLTSIILGEKIDRNTGPQPICWASWFVRITAALNLVRAFEILHLRGYSFQDINPGSFRINVKTGEVLICDCDNIVPNGENSGILGVTQYMAPEIVRGERLPDLSTDQYSMAIILFRLLFHDHPLHGKETIRISQMDLSEDERALRNYGINPLYCLNSKDKKNEPDPRIHRDVCRLSKTYPKVLLDAFEQCFVISSMNRNLRLTDTDWRKVLFAVRDSLVQIDGREQFLQPNCKRIPTACRKLVCKTLGRQIYVMPNKILYAYHLEEYGADYYTPMLKVVASPEEPNLLGIINRLGKPIPYALPDGRNGEVPHGNAIALLPGMTIRLNKCTYTIE